MGAGIIGAKIGRRSAAIAYAAPARPVYTGSRDAAQRIKLIVTAFGSDGYYKLQNAGDGSLLPVSATDYDGRVPAGADGYVLAIDYGIEPTFFSAGTIAAYEVLGTWE